MKVNKTYIFVDNITKTGIFIGADRIMDARNLILAASITPHSSTHQDGDVLPLNEEDQASLQIRNDYVFFYDEAAIKSKKFKAMDRDVHCHRRGGK